MSEEEKEEAEETQAQTVGLIDCLAEQFGSAPWWVISATVHALILLIMTVIYITPLRKPEDIMILHGEVLPPKPPMEKREKDRPFDPIPSPADPVEHPPEEEPIPIDILLPEAEDYEIDVDKPFKEPKHNVIDSLSDLNSRKVGVIDFVGVGPGNPGHGRGLVGLRGRGGDRDSARRRFIGSETKPYLNRALAWLARHQEPAGHWDARKYGGQKTDVGVTGLALLAFLGDGHSEINPTKYRENVRRAVKWLISQQQADGCIGRGYERGLGYHHAIAGLALAEATAMSGGRSPATTSAAQRAVDYSVNKHQTEYSGWRYSARQEPDMSVTGWFVMQLKSAKVAGLKVEGKAFQGAVSFLDKVTSTTDYPGRVSYMPGRSATPTMTAVGVLSRQFMGWGRDEEVIRGGLQYVLEHLPRWENNSNVNFYYWYYGTLGVFQDSARGRTVSPEWKRWNEAMKKALLPHQIRGGDDDGSWEPVGQWCSAGGRAYSTALGALCLEVYYRYNFEGTYR